METILVLNKVKEEFKSKMFDVLCELISENQDLHHKSGNDFVSVNIKKDKYTIIGVKSNFDYDEGEYTHLSYRYSYVGQKPNSVASDVTFDDMLLMAEQIDQNSNPFRPLKEYRKYGKFELKIVYCDDYKPTNKISTIEGKTLEDVFVKFYKANNHLRYCNGSYYQFVEKNDEEQYRSWLNVLPRSYSFDLYYGNGIVD